MANSPAGGFDLFLCWKGKKIFSGGCSRARVCWPVLCCPFFDEYFIFSCFGARYDRRAWRRCAPRASAFTRPKKLFRWARTISRCWLICSATRLSSSATSPRPWVHFSLFSETIRCISTEFPRRNYFRFQIMTLKSFFKKYLFVKNNFKKM